MKAIRVFALLTFASLVSIFAPERRSTAQDFPGLGPPGSLTRLQFERAQPLILSGPNDRAQLVLTGHYSSGQQHDFTHEVKYAATPPGVVEVSADGFVTPISDGQTTI
ncbi:MAG: S-layer protein, partial [Planctomycetes bacterium]|nr:S-layer protein [Planctomycetota bacterium]